MADQHIEPYHDFSFDESFAGIPYLPWVGKHYRNSPHKILVVAESVYGGKKGDKASKESLASPVFVRHCVREIGLHFTMVDPWAGSDSQRMYRNTERLIFNEHVVSDEQKMKLWTSVAFHEFVQRPMKNKDEKPCKKDFIEGAGILKTVLYVLKPRLCVFLGTDNEKLKPIVKTIPLHGVWHGKINGAIPKTVQFREMDCAMVMVKHPSSWSTLGLWADFIEAHSSGIITDLRRRP